MPAILRQGAWLPGGPALLCGLLLAVLPPACTSRTTAPGGPPVELRMQTAPASPGSIPDGLGREAKEAWSVLAATRRFTDDAIYDGGETPKEVLALRILWREPSASAAFRALLERGSTGGRLFALCGLYYADPEAFERGLRELRGTGERLTFQTGCTTLLEYPVADLVELQRPDVVRLEDRGQSIRAWKSLDSGRFSFVYDIAGGGFPNLFKEAGGYCDVQPRPLAEGAD